MMRCLLKSIRQAASLPLVLLAPEVRRVVQSRKLPIHVLAGVGAWVVDGSSMVNKTDRTTV